jgi:hypothetical protein
MLIIKLAKNVRIVWASSDGSPSKSIDIVPIDKNVDTRFFGLVLSKMEDEISAGIPLDKNDFEYQEERHSIELGSVRLEFFNTEDAITFWHAYRRLKFLWSQEQREYGNLQHDIGPMFGYAGNQE